MPGTPLLVSTLRDPQSTLSWGERQWDLLVRQARTAGLLGRLGALLDSEHLLDQVPEAVRRHLDSARAGAERHAEAVRWEVGCIRHALRDLDMPLVLLKGAAYVLADLPAARGRVFHDVDIMVPLEQLGQVEKSLTVAGWVGSGLDEYDQRYYRRWMHELPPFKHYKRKTLIDVHHRILPRTARNHPDPDKLFAATRATAAGETVRVFAPVDLVLHSACHLFHEGEFDHGLRDLTDLDALLRDFEAGQPQFWDSLVARAAELDLERPLFYATRYCSRILHTPVPESVSRSLSARVTGFSGARTMDALFDRALLPDHASCADAGTGMARWSLYVRGHYLRMPLYLLIPHLVRKAFVRQMQT